MAPRTWFITGASGGFGRAWSEAALARGERVAAAARNPAVLEDLVAEFGEAVLPLRLDVTERDAVTAAVGAAHERFGRLDVVVNNAGYGLGGMVEEAGEEEFRAQLETNFLGSLWVIQAALPFLREQGAGHLIQVSSIGGIAAFPGLGLYNASKWAVEGMVESLAAEVAPFGIRVTLVEPGGFDTGASAAAAQTEPLAAYDEFRAEARRRAGERRAVLGDPRASAAALLRVVEAEEAPLRTFFGSAPLAIAEADYAKRLALWREWQPVAALAQGEADPAGAKAAG
ncbi:MAG: SDR family NAD(P)-dependent oxidoreductase [Solirubrobacterales bacterium]